MTPIPQPLLATLREIAAAEAAGLEYRASGGLPEMRQLAGAGLAVGAREHGRRMVWTVTADGRAAIEEFSS